MHAPRPDAGNSKGAAEAKTKRTEQARQLMGLDQKMQLLDKQNDLLRQHVNNTLAVAQKLREAGIEVENLTAPLDNSFDARLILLSKQLLAQLEECEVREKNIFILAKKLKADLEEADPELTASPKVSRLEQEADFARQKAHDQLARLVNEKVYTPTYRAQKAGAEQMIEDDLKLTSGGGELQEKGVNPLQGDEDIDALLGDFKEQITVAGNNQDLAAEDVDLEDLNPPETESIGEFTGAGAPSVKNSPRMSIPRGRPVTKPKKRPDEPGDLKFGAL